MKYKIGVAVVSLLIVIAGFLVLNFEKEDNIDKDKYSDNGLPAVGNLTSFDESVNAFALKFYKEFHRDHEDNNIFISPYSIFTALAMTYEGARNTTAEEMKNVLSIEQDNESFHRYMQMLYEYLNERSEYNISTANALWPRVGYNLLQNYTNIIETYYGGKISEVDYSKPEEAAGIINSWIENKTNHLIKNLISPAAITPDTMLILTNAIYFKGIWKLQFDIANTTSREFKTPNGNIDVPMMQMVNTNNLFNYTENKEMQVLELPYSGDNISMLIFLPKKSFNTSDIVEYLNETTFYNIIDSMSEKKVDIYLPRFEIKTPMYELNKYLVNLGMPTAFSANADFSGIDGVGGLSISQVLHKAFIKVDENGTEAAAATAVMFVTAVNGDSNSRIIFDCDHPFLFMIYHKQSNTILFMGSIINPLLE
ncbi:MAG: serpin family protein [Thermoplasmata archaeon]|nr:MAG: serpin family protein [Thermoplasmata archaeon]